VVERPLSHEIIKEFHGILKRGSEDSFKGWFKIGDYKTKNNFIGDRETVAPSEVLKKMDLLINNYLKEGADIHKIIDFHYEFEKIHPFQDGNGRVGRLIMFKECLKNNIVPFVIENENKQFYYMGLKEYEKSKTRLVETCLYSQDVYKDAVKYFIDGSVKQIKNNDNLIKNIHIPLENDKILSVMNCYKYEVKEENIIDFRGKELFIDSTEIIFGKKNIIKMNCKDKEGKDLYLLQRTGKEKMEIWYFDKDFTIASSKEFIKQFDCKFTKNEQNIVKNKMCR
jgi:Fic family protein